MNSKDLHSKILNQILDERESIRHYSLYPIPHNNLISILDAAQGLRKGNIYFRKSPSAGGLYPITIYVASSIHKPKGIYKYYPDDKQLVLHRCSDEIYHSFKMEPISYIAKCCLNQYWISAAPCVLLLTILKTPYNSTVKRYGPQGIAYNYMNVGYMAENIHLMATAHELGSCSVGAFHDEILNKVYYDKRVNTVLVIPIGYAAK